MNSNKIVNVTTPSAALDAANKSYVDTSIPIGGIIMWSGLITADFPSNWKLCDGGNGTPDLRGRFILCAGHGSDLTNRLIRATGGVETVALTLAQMPSHSHGVSATATTEGLHSHNVGVLNGSGYQSGYDGGYSGYNIFGTVQTTQAGSHSHTITVTESSRGSSQAHENMPPFYVLAFIMRIS